MKPPIEKITRELRKKTKDKFNSWDEVVEKEMMSGSPGQVSYALKLLKDPTIYTYAFFKNKEGGPMKLYPYQDLIINDTHPRVIFCAANQIGKSVTLCCKALHYALTNPGKTVLMTSKTEKQAMDLLLEIKRLLRSGKVDYKSQIGESETKTEIYFKHFNTVDNDDGTFEKRELSQSRIIVCPATEAILGYPVDLALPDELGFYENGRYFYYQLLQPRTYTTKGQIMTFSNPNGQQGIYWELWNNPDFHRYRFNYLDCPTNTLKEYEKLKKNLSTAEFDSTVNAVFTSAEGGFFTQQEKNTMQEDRPSMIPSILTQPVYIFFDFAKKRDRTVRGVGVPVIDESGVACGVYVYEMKEYPEDTPYTEVIGDLRYFIDVHKVHNVAMVGWDNTGVGQGLEDFIKLLENIGITCIPVEFSLQNKSRIYTTFKLLAERGVREGLSRGISIPFDANCDKQLSELRFKTTPRGYLQVHHSKEKIRDDFPDMLAGLCSLIIQPDSPPVTCIIVEDSSKKNPFADEMGDNLGFV